MLFLILSLVLPSLFFSVSNGLPHHRKATPKVSGTPQVVGTFTDPVMVRDSCVSVHVFDREFWTCRDTMGASGYPGFFSSSTASWTDFNADRTPAVKNGMLTAYGNNTGNFFPLQPDECAAGGQSGGCPDNSRYEIWPNYRPLPSHHTHDSVSLYTWIPVAHSDSSGGPVDGITNPRVSLYRSDYTTSQPHNALPVTTLVDQTFYAEDTIAYGNNGWVKRKGMVYLYGALSGFNLKALARVPEDQIEDRSAYSYYVPSSNTWSSTPPSLTDTSATVVNAGAGPDGTYYHSKYFNSFVWIGTGPYPGPAFLITTAPAPEGPWAKPTLLYTAADGTEGLGSYSGSAHPGLSEDRGNGKDIYLSYTKVDEEYVTPLIRVQWE